ncbi:MAG: methyltransferase domain-containing protein [Anaerolineae bacterium]|jgi:2-polyprenyl-3-methyl-5-hydroxy-6-metoxy-1,4-benzoquinol methylase|nr:methyltransferase domain-containing protein [Anaerolineae bacterium]
MSIQAVERDAYAELWSSVSAYKRNSPGEQYAKTFHAIVNDPGATVLDAGCGEGRGMVALDKLGYVVAGLDLTDAGLSAEAKAFPFMQETIWNDLNRVRQLFHSTRTHVFGGKVDYVYCCDVLEHLPTQFTMLAVEKMIRVSKKGVFLSIFFIQDGYGPWVGRHLHQTVQPFTWWRDALRELCDVVEARDCHEFGIFYVRAR